MVIHKRSVRFCNNLKHLLKSVVRIRKNLKNMQWFNSRKINFNTSRIVYSLDYITMPYLYKIFDGSFYNKLFQTQNTLKYSLINY